jgi:hypothetical protein
MHGAMPVPVREAGPKQCSDHLWHLRLHTLLPSVVIVWKGTPSSNGTGLPGSIDIESGKIGGTSCIGWPMQ